MHFPDKRHLSRVKRKGNGMLYQFLKPDFEHIDKRGGLVQLVRDGYKQVNYIYSSKDTVRGNHYHKQNTEAFYIIRGSMSIDLRNVNTGEQDVLHVKSGDMFMIFSYVMHTFTYHEDSELVSMYDKGVELSNGKMDVYENHNGENI